jgi:hypothetical protein
MGMLHVELVTMGTRAETDATMPVAKLQARAQATLDTTTTAARVGSLAATGLDQAWVMTAVGADVYVRGSANASSNAAGPNQGTLIPAGATVARGVSAIGEQLSARDRA